MAISFDCGPTQRFAGYERVRRALAVHRYFRRAVCVDLRQYPCRLKGNPWVHDTSATPARVLWRWDNVMASSALRSGLRSTACMQAVDLKTKLHLRLTGRHRRSVENCGVTRSLPRSGPAARSLSGPSNWPSAGGGGIAATSWHASRTCGTAWAKALRWDIPQSRSLAGWRANMVVSSSAMSQSIVSSIIVRPRRITGTACCRAINSDEGAADPQAAALPASSNNDARSLNDPPRSKAAMCRAIGKPASCCSPDMAKGCWFSTNDNTASASFCTRSIEKPSSPLGPSPVNSANFHKRCAKPSASTTEPSSPSITGFTKPSVSKPSSAIPIVPGKKAAWKTPSGYYDAHCHVKLTSTPLRQPPSSGSFGASTIPHANAWTSRHPPRHSPNSNQSLHFKRDSISLLSQGRQCDYFFAAAARSTNVLPPFILWVSGASLIWITTASASTPRFFTSACVMSRIMPAFCSSVRPAAMLTVISGILVTPFSYVYSPARHCRT